MNLTLRRILYIFFSFFGFLTVGLVGVIFYFSFNLPSHEHLKDFFPPVSTVVYDRKYNVVAEFSKEKRFFVPIKDIPSVVQKAFISIEDKNFFFHDGLDYFSIFTRFFSNFSKYISGKRAAGASTITQQVVKNFLVGDAYSYTRKIREAILSWRLEKSLSKERILEIYLNQIYLGDRCYGIEAAARNYFGKNIKELTLAESAVLAALPKSPSHFNPARYPERILDRRNYVLKLMLEQAFITEDEYQKAIKAKIVIRSFRENFRAENDFFIEDVRRELLRNFSEEEVYNKGLCVYTSLDQDLQKIVDTVLEEAIIKEDRVHGWRGVLKNVGKQKLSFANVHDWKLQDYILSKKMNLAKVKEVKANSVIISVIIGIDWGKRKYLKAKIVLDQQAVNWTGKKIANIFNVGDLILIRQDNQKKWELHQLPDFQGAIIAANPTNGQILAMSGGYDFRFSKFNRASQSARQIGSVAKILVIMAALEKGFPATYLLKDEPLTFKFRVNSRLKIWEPKNWDRQFWGSMTLRYAFEYSRNLPMIELLEKVGVVKVANIASRLGLTDNFPLNLSSALGSVEISPINLLKLLIPIANGGRYFKPNLIDNIKSYSSKILFLDPNIAEIKNDGSVIYKSKSVLDPLTAFQTANVLESTVRRGLCARLNKIPAFLGAKTGSSSSQKDCWLVIINPKLVVVIMIINDKNKPLSGLSGRVTMPIGERLLKEIASEFLSKSDFKVPGGLKMVKVSRKMGCRDDDDQNYFEYYRAGQEPNNKAVVAKDSDSPQQIKETQEEVNLYDF